MVSCGTGLANAIIWVDRQAVEVGGLVSMMAWASMTSPSSTITLLGATSVTVQLHLTERPWLRCAGNADIPRAGRAASPRANMARTKRTASAGTDKDSSKNTPPRNGRKKALVNRSEKPSRSRNSGACSALASSGRPRMPCRPRRRLRRDLMSPTLKSFDPTVRHTLLG